MSSKLADCSRGLKTSKKGAIARAKTPPSIYLIILTTADLKLFFIGGISLSNLENDD
jgi:hypothetical protein